jgi:large subunit ribosomal protein L15e
LEEPKHLCNKEAAEYEDLLLNFGCNRRIRIKMDCVKLSNTIIRGFSYPHLMRHYNADTWLKMWKSNSDELKGKAINWRKEPSIHRIPRPSRLDRARKIGYKAKQGIVVVRARVGRGGMRKQRPVSGRRPKHLGVVRIKQGTSMRKVAEKRVGEKFPNLEVVGSYYLHKDGMHQWFEVVLVDPMHGSISKDREMRGKLVAFSK